MSDPTPTVAVNPFAKKAAPPSFPDEPIVGGPATSDPSVPTITVAPKTPEPIVPDDDEDDEDDEEETPPPPPVKTVRKKKKVDEPAPAPAPPPPGPGGMNLPVVGTKADDGPPPPGSDQYNPHGDGGSNGDLPDDFEIDLTDVQDGGLDQIELGKHLLVCTGVTQGMSNAGNRKIVFAFRVLSGPSEGKRRSAHIPLTPEMLWKLDNVLKATGVTDSESRKPTIREIKTLVPDRVLIGEFVKGKPYNGIDTTDLNRFYPPDEAGIQCGTTLTELLAGN